jgi:signal transduction histidine kinase
MVVSLYFYAIGILLAGVLNTLFGFSVYIKNKKNISGITYALMSLAVAVWCYPWFAMLLVDKNESLALFFARLLNFGAVFIPSFYFHWILSILGIEKENKRNIIACYSITIFFAFLSWTPYFVQGVHSVLFFPYWPTAGFIYIFYLIFGYLTFPAYGIYLLFKKLNAVEKNDKIKKNQLRYVLLGSFMGFGGGALNFFLMYSINPFGPFFEAGVFLVLLVYVPFAVPLAYATMKYHLMDIKLVLTEMLAGLISATLLIDSVFSIFTYANPLVILFKFSVFITFSYVGVKFIRSVLREIELREKIENAKKEVDGALEGEKRANDSLELFMTGLQHDIKGYLTPIIATSSSLIDGSGIYSKLVKGGIQLNKEGIYLIKMYGRKAIGARDQSDDFMAIAKFRQGKPILSLDSAVDLSFMLEELINSFETEAESNGIALEFEKPDEKFVVPADQIKLKSALRNVIGNSIKYTPKGKVAVGITKEEGNKILIKVEDTGIGIPAEKVATLFSSPFERTEEARKTAGGSGFGLYFASLIIGLHNGKIWVESEGEGKGSKFYIELPTEKDEKISIEKDNTTKMNEDNFKSPAGLSTSEESLGEKGMLSTRAPATPMEKDKKDYALWYKEVGEDWIKAHDDKGKLIQEDYWGTTDKINNAKYQKDFEQKLIEKNRGFLRRLFRRIFFKV